MNEGGNTEDPGFHDSSDFEMIDFSPSYPPLRVLTKPPRPPRPGLKSTLFGRLKRERVELLQTGFEEIDLNEEGSSRQKSHAVGTFSDLIEAIRANDTAKAVELIESGEIVLFQDHNEAIRLAAQLGRLELIVELLKVKNVNPSDQTNEAIRLAAKNGHYAVVKLLMEHPQVQRQERYNVEKLSDLDSDLYETALENAAAKGHLNIVELITKDQDELSSPERAYQGFKHQFERQTSA